jgi:hypothetical protein
MLLRGLDTLWVCHTVTSTDNCNACLVVLPSGQQGAGDDHSGVSGRNHPADCR